MPIYEFSCEECGTRFEEFTAVGAPAPACPECGREETHRVYSVPSPPGRLPRGAAARESDARRGEREAARRDRLAEAAKKRSRGEDPR